MTFFDYFCYRAIDSTSKGIEWQIYEQILRATLEWVPPFVVILKNRMVCMNGLHLIEATWMCRLLKTSSRLLCSFLVFFVPHPTLWWTKPWYGILCCLNQDLWLSSLLTKPKVPSRFILSCSSWVARRELNYEPGFAQHAKPNLVLAQQSTGVKKTRDQQGSYELFSGRSHVCVVLVILTANEAFIMQWRLVNKFIFCSPPLNMWLL